MSRVYIGIDNGPTGAIGILAEGCTAEFFVMPTNTAQDYHTSKVSMISRVVVPDLMEILKGRGLDVRVFLEKPFTHQHAHKTTISGMRAYEATLIAVELLGLSYETVTSMSWQKAMLPPRKKGTKSAELKQQSKDRGIRLFPELEEEIIKQKDADSLLIAEWARRNKL